MDLINILNKRYASKSFDGSKISEDKIEELKEIIRLAPSSFNLQPWKIKVITDKTTLKLLEEKSYFNKQIANSSALFVFCVEYNTGTLIENLSKLSIKKGRDENKVKEYSNMMRQVFSNFKKEDIEKWAERQLYLALENLMIGATSLKLDSCPIEGFDSQGYIEILNIPKNLKPIVICPVGIANDKVPEKIRFEKEEIFF